VSRHHAAPYHHAMPRHHAKHLGRAFKSPHFGQSKVDLFAFLRLRQHSCSLLRIGFVLLSPVSSKSQCIANPVA
jgi:hypothetical protein